MNAILSVPVGASPAGPLRASTVRLLVAQKMISQSRALPVTESPAGASAPATPGKAKHAATAAPRRRSNAPDRVPVRLLERTGSPPSRHRRDPLALADADPSVGAPLDRAMTRSSGGGNLLRDRTPGAPLRGRSLLPGRRSPRGHDWRKLRRPQGRSSVGRRLVLGRSQPHLDGSDVARCRAARAQDRERKRLPGRVGPPCPPAPVAVEAEHRERLRESRPRSSSTRGSARLISRVCRHAAQLAVPRSGATRSPAGAFYGSG